MADASIGDGRSSEVQSRDAIITMRQSCTACGCALGVVSTSNGQDVVRCQNCRSYAYCRPRSESGRDARTKATRPNLKVSVRARILARDNGTCVLCHRADVALDVGHLLSVRDAKSLGLGPEQFMADENLAAMCDACNSGLSSSTVPLWLLVAVLRARAATAA